MDLYHLLTLEERLGNFLKLLCKISKIVRVPELSQFMNGISLWNLIRVHRFFHCLYRRFSLPVMVRMVTKAGWKLGGIGSVLAWAIWGIVSKFVGLRRSFAALRMTRAAGAFGRQELRERGGKTIGMVGNIW
jgi:hypothetical protein